MDGHLRESRQPNALDNARNSKAAWSWRNTGLFHPETDDWALGRGMPPPPERPADSWDQARDASQRSRA